MSTTNLTAKFTFAGKEYHVDCKYVEGEARTYEHPGTAAEIADFKIVYPAISGNEFIELNESEAFHEAMLVAADEEFLRLDGEKYASWAKELE